MCEKSTESKITKEKVLSVEIIVTGKADKPYYEIKYFDLADGRYHIGYSSYDLENVVKWREECFEVVEDMSMLSQQIEQLKDLRFRMGTENKPTSTDWKIIDSAIDTIESLSAKLSAANMERSKQYYGGGWIACNNGENLPKEAEHNALSGWSEEVRPSDYVLCKAIDGNIFKGFYSYSFNSWTDFKENCEYVTGEIIAWLPLPKTDKE